MGTVNLHRPGECMEDFNQFALLFNAELRETANKLNGELSEAHVVYSDMYSLVSTIIANPLKYGKLILFSQRGFFLVSKSF